MPESETTGSCSKQLSPQLTKRNCRYGKCEQIKNGTDYVCHCDMVINCVLLALLIVLTYYRRMVSNIHVSYKFITGRKCDRPSSDQNDPCLSNPCWGDSLCIVTNVNTKEFKCICSNFRRGKYCHVRLIGPTMLIDKNDPVPVPHINSKLNSNNNNNNNNKINNNINKNKIMNNNDLAKIAATFYKTFGSSSTRMPELTPANQRYPVSMFDKNARPLLTINNMANNRQIVSKLNGMKLMQQNSNMFNTSRILIKDTVSNDRLHAMKPNVDAIKFNVHQKLNTSTLNTFVPKMENVGPCNYDTCQLGKCLDNGTCECVHPAIGKYCDRIDECLILKCVYVKKSFIFLFLLFSSLLIFRFILLLLSL